MPSPLDRSDEIAQEFDLLQARIAGNVSAEDFDPESEDHKKDLARVTYLARQMEGIKDFQARMADYGQLRSTLGTRPPANQEVDLDDLGSFLVRSDAFRSFVRGGGTGAHRLMEIPMNLRATLTTAAFPSPKSRVVAPAPNRLNPLLNALNRQQVSSNAVEVVYYPAAAPLAAVVPEGTLKPEATMAITITTVTLETLAHWKEATRQLLEDEARMRDFISGALVRGVTDKAESNAATTIQGGTYTAAAGTSMAAAIRAGIAQVQTAGYNPNGILINPLDAADLDVFVWETSTGSPSVGGSLWGVPLIPVAAISAGSAFVGDFNAAVDFYYRGSVDLFVTDSDVDATTFASNFKRNIITFLAEMRCKTHVVRPEAISEAAKTP
jgi:HK97 family phage major capsid protein